MEVKYVGRATERSIAASDFAAHDITQDDVVWNEANNFTADVSKEAWAFLEEHNVTEFRLVTKEEKAEAKEAEKPAAPAKKAARKG